MKERKHKIYDEDCGILSDFHTNISCDILFKYLFIKQEKFSSELVILSDKTYKLKCVYRPNSDFDKLDN